MLNVQIKTLIIRLFTLVLISQIGFNALPDMK